LQPAEKNNNKKSSFAAVGTKSEFPPLLCFNVLQMELWLAGGFDIFSAFAIATDYELFSVCVCECVCVFVCVCNIVTDN